MATTVRPQLLIALHARRSAEAIAAFRLAQPAVPIVLVLTGTDLYRDIIVDPAAQQALLDATQLVVLQTAGLAALPTTLHDKTRVIFQSAATLKPLQHKAARRALKVIMIGHLRAEKDPLTYLQACLQCRDQPIRFTHIGGALDPSLAAAALDTARQTSHYQWLGNLPHAVTRQRLKRQDLMVISSVMEGGANVIIEAVTSGVAVLASDISGNRGMLGDDYAGYFPVGDAVALAALLRRADSDTAFLTMLQYQCRLRAPLFAPETERAAVLQLVDNHLPASV